MAIFASPQLKPEKTQRAPNWFRDILLFPLMYIAHPLMVHHEGIRWSGWEGVQKSESLSTVI